VGAGREYSGGPRGDGARAVGAGGEGGAVDGRRGEGVLRPHGA